MSWPRQSKTGSSYDESEARRTATHDGDLPAGGRGVRRQADLTVLALVVGDEPLQVANAQRLELVAQDAASLALSFLGADAASDRRQDIVLADLGRGRQVVPLLDEADELADAD